MRKLYLPAALAAVCVLIPTLSIDADDNTEAYRQLKLFADVFERVRADYVEEVSDERLIEAAIRGMLADLDPHSSYLDADSYKDMQVQTRGEFGGLGIEVTMEGQLIKVVSPIDDTPAFRAGVEAGDFITHLDGDSVLGLSLSDAVDKMRGPVNSDIRLTIRREGRDPFDVNITRDIIKIRSVRARIENDISYLRITAFNEQTSPGIAKEIAKAKEELGPDLIGFVLDLRNNPGGLLDQAIEVSDSFLDQGEIVSTRGRRDDDTQRFNAREGDLAEGKPIVVLINGGSASASEIVAGALQDHGRAILMGTPSFGKGSVQTIVPLGGHGAMRMTTARYYTPSGRSIQAKGIEPDILVEAARIERIAVGNARREADLRGALENTDGGAGEQSSEQSTGTGDTSGSGGATDADSDAGAEERPVDYQLSRAYDLLRGLDLFDRRVVN